MGVRKFGTSRLGSVLVGGRKTQEAGKLRDGGGSKDASGILDRGRAGCRGAGVETFLNGDRCAKTAGTVGGQRIISQCGKGCERLLPTAQTKRCATTATLYPYSRKEPNMSRCSEKQGKSFGFSRGGREVGLAKPGSTVGHHARMEGRTWSWKRLPTTRVMSACFPGKASRVRAGSDRPFYFGLPGVSTFASTRLQAWVGRYLLASIFLAWVQVVDPRKIYLPAR